MANLKELYDLIHSLDKYEKIQVSKHINALAGKSKNRYYNDYQCINKAKIYEKNILKDRLIKLEKRNNLSESNTNLYNFICDSLIKTRQNKNKKIGLLRDLQVTELLFERGLIAQSDKFHQQSILKTEEIGENYLKLFLLGNADRLLLRREKINAKIDIRKQNLEKELILIEELKFKLKIQTLKRKVYSTAAKIGTPRSQEHLDQYLHYYNDELLKKTPNNLSKETLYQFYDLKILVSTVTQKPTVVLSLLEDALKDIRKAYNKKQNPKPEYQILKYFVEVSTFEGTYAQVKESTENLEKMKPLLTLEVDKKIIETKIIWAWLLHYIYAGDSEKGYNYLISNKENILNKKTNKYSAFNYLNIFYAARVCFLNNKFEESLEYLDILFEKSNSIRNTLNSHLHFLVLLNHYKLNNLEYLPYAIKSAYRSFLKEKILYEPEKALLHFLRKASNALDIKKEMKKLYNTLLPLQKSRFHDSFFGNGDYIKWLETELTN